MAANPTAGQPVVRSYSASSDVGTIIAVVLLQYVWLAQSIGQKLAFVNLFPAALLITLWTLFISHYYSGRTSQKILWMLPVVILCLRLPVTVSSDLQFVNWLMYLMMAWAVIRRILTAMPEKTERIYLLLAFIILSANAFHHLGYDSPYTYTFRLSNQMVSDFKGEENLFTWECPHYQTKYPVHCDSRHFVISEMLFTDLEAKVQDSVVLQRFLHGYLNSLIGHDHTRYWANLMLNITFWLFACACIYRICRLLKLDKNVAGISMLCGASAWGFVSMVAQPEPYLMAYSYALIAIWATLEMIYGQLDRRRTIFYVSLIAGIVLVYDAYQIILISVFLLYFYKKRTEAVSIFILQIALTAIWSMYSLQTVLGTQGEITNASHSINNIKLDITTWWGIITTFNIPQALHLSFVGLQAYVYGNLIIGALAAWAYIFGLNRPKPTTPEQKTLLLLLVVLNVMVVACAIFIVPQMYHWSPETGMQPRILFYSFPINMIALVLIASHRIQKKHMWVIPAVMFMLVNINLTGLASIDMMFDYGMFGIYWK